MRLDRIVHSNPRFYAWKLQAIANAKRALYKVLSIDDEVARLREEISARNQSLIRQHLAGKRVLEIGCGAGSFLASLHKDYGCTCVGIDVSDEMIRFASSANPGPTYRVMDSSKLEFADNAFDVIVFNYVLHHVRDLAHDCRSQTRRKKIVFYECCAWERQPASSSAALLEINRRRLRVPHAKRVEVPVCAPCSTKPAAADWCATECVLDVSGSFSTTDH
jgi:SAM-dependent methyltransferase